jgi:hypothetical protein
MPVVFTQRHTKAICQQHIDPVYPDSNLEVLGLTCGHSTYLMLTKPFIHLMLINWYQLQLGLEDSHLQFSTCMACSKLM